MSKFKVGDKVVRTVGDFGFVRQGDVFSVTGLRSDGQMEINGDDKYCHNPRNFELHVEEAIEDILTPVQAAESILNKDKLQVFDSDVNKWYGFHCELRDITLEDLKHIKLRYRPKTIVVNGVEVPAPMTNEEVVNCEDRRTGFYIELAHKRVYSKRIFGSQIVWATREDAQQVLDAMLIPFNQL